MQKGDLNAIRAIVAFGADVNRSNAYSQTPLDVAKFLHKEDICKFLREVGGMDSNAARCVNSPILTPIQVQEGNEQEDAPREDDFGEGGEREREREGEGGRDFCSLFCLQVVGT